MAVVLWASSVSPVHAYLVYDTALVPFNDSISVSDHQGGGLTSNDNASLGSSQLAQFNPSYGVLTGVTVNLDSTLTSSLAVTGRTVGQGTTVSGSGAGNAAISAPGVSYTSANSVANGSCNPASRGASCSTTTAGPVVNATQGLVVSGSLDSYVGTGTVSVDRTAPTFNAEQTAGTGTTQYDLNWAGNLSASYTYLLHAAPSFDGANSIDSLTLDFGTVSQDSVASALSFSIFNLADPDRTDLDLIDISGTGATGVLGSDLSLFQNLMQGGDLLFYATLDTATSGNFLATYVLTFSDAANIGATSSHNTYTLTLTLTGNVTAVPVPDSVWLLGSGLIGVVGVARRKPH